MVLSLAGLQQVTYFFSENVFTLSVTQYAISYSEFVSVLELSYQFLS